MARRCVFWKGERGAPAFGFPDGEKVTLEDRGGEVAEATPACSASGRYNASGFARFCNFVIALNSIQEEQLQGQANDHEKQ